VTCTKTGPKNDPFFNCRRKTKELLKKELSNVTPASLTKQTINCSNDNISTIKQKVRKQTAQQLSKQLNNYQLSTNLGKHFF
jgi:hypothetical protein